MHHFCTTRFNNPTTNLSIICPPTPWW